MESTRTRDRNINLHRIIVLKRLILFVDCNRREITFIWFYYLLHILLTLSRYNYSTLPVGGPPVMLHQHQRVLLECFKEALIIVVIMVSFDLWYNLQLSTWASYVVMWSKYNWVDDIMVTKMFRSSTRRLIKIAVENISAFSFNVCEHIQIKALQEYKILVGFGMNISGNTCILWDWIIFYSLLTTSVPSIIIQGRTNRHDRHMSLVRLLFCTLSNVPLYILLSSNTLISWWLIVNTLRPRRNRRHFADGFSNKFSIIFLILFLRVR